VSEAPDGVLFFFKNLLPLACSDHAAHWLFPSPLEMVAMSGDDE